MWSPLGFKEGREYLFLEKSGKSKLNVIFEMELKEGLEFWQVEMVRVSSHLTLPLDYKLNLQLAGWFLQLTVCPWFVSLCNFTSQWRLRMRIQKWSFIIINMVGLKTYMKKYDFSSPPYLLYVTGPHFFIFILEFSPVLLIHLAEHLNLVIQAFLDLSAKQNLSFPTFPSSWAPHFPTTWSAWHLTVVTRMVSYIVFYY